MIADCRWSGWSESEGTIRAGHLFNLGPNEEIILQTDIDLSAGFGEAFVSANFFISPPPCPPGDLTSVVFSCETQSLRTEIGSCMARTASDGSLLVNSLNRHVNTQFAELLGHGEPCTVHFGIRGGAGLSLTLSNDERFAALFQQRWDQQVTDSAARLRQLFNPKRSRERSAFDMLFGAA